MDTAILSSLGLDPAKLQEMIVDRAVDELVGAQTVFEYEDGDAKVRRVEGAMASITSKLVMERINAKIAELAAAHILPKLDQQIERMVLQETTKWGEAKGAPMSITEYIVARADAWIADEVDASGKSKAESGSYDWRGKTTRITFAVDQYLRLHIHSAMERILKDANSTIAKGLEGACKIAIADAATKFRIEAKTG